MKAIQILSYGSSDRIQAIESPRPSARPDEVFGFANGAYAEFVSVSRAAIALKPRSIDFETAAGLPTPALTAYQARRASHRDGFGQ